MYTSNNKIRTFISFYKLGAYDMCTHVHLAIYTVDNDLPGWVWGAPIAAQIQHMEMKRCESIKGNKKTVTK